MKELYTLSPELLTQRPRCRWAARFSRWTTAPPLCGR